MPLQKVALANQLNELLYNGAFAAFKAMTQSEFTGGDPAAFADKQADEFAKAFRDETADQMANIIDIYVRTGAVNLTTGTIS